MNVSIGNITDTVNKGAPSHPKQNECAALGLCRQNLIATNNGTAIAISYLLFLVCLLSTDTLIKFPLPYQT
jgi:hypothetical protein